MLKISVTGKEHNRELFSWDEIQTIYGTLFESTQSENALFWVVNHDVVLCIIGKNIGKAIPCWETHTFYKSSAKLDLSIQNGDKE